LGNIYLRNEAWPNAAAQFEKALNRNPDDAAALIGMSSALRKQKQPDKAMEVMNRAVELHPSNPQVYSVRSRLYRDSGLLGAALSDLEAAEKLDGRDYWIAYDKGRTLLSMDKKPEALAAFEKANSVDSTEFVAYIFSAGIRTDSGDFDGAEKDYTALTRVNPDYYYGFEGLGMLKMKKKEYREARDAFTAAYQKAPSETGYAILAALCALRGQSRFEVKPFLETAMKPLKRDSLEYAILRLLNDYSGDTELSKKIQNEKDPYIKCKTAFYIAEYYDITNKHAMAEIFYETCKSTNRRDTIEWRLNEWVREQQSMLAQP
jgi:tetratricopeptide (TPR) repeat protein